MSPFLFKIDNTVQMPACAEEHLKMNMCGTVITCDWREAEKDKVRPVANSTADFKCCYRTVIVSNFLKRQQPIVYQKEKGDCDLQLAEAQIKEKKEQQPPVEVHVQSSASSLCTNSILPWVISSILTVALALEVRLLRIL